MMTMRIMEIFAGIGAWAQALKNIGVEHEVVSAIEFDKGTMDCYNAIHGTSFEPIDITTHDPKSIEGEIDGIFYSPPCQAFSDAGKQLGFDDNRGVLFFGALKTIKEKMPKFNVMENVDGLTKSKFINEFKSMLLALDEVGYVNYWAILNAKDYGVPQNRKRVFVVSIRKDIDITRNFEFPAKKALTKTLGDYLEKNVDQRYVVKTTDRTTTCEDTTLGQPTDKLVIKGYVRGLNRDGQRVLGTNGITGTLKATGEQNPVMVDGVIRRITPKESIRLMGFGDKAYEKLVETNTPETMIKKVAGNSIVVEMVQEVVASVISYVENQPTEVCRNA